MNADIFLSSEKIMENIVKGDFNQLLNGLCFIHDGSIILNYVYFKHIATSTTYQYIMNCIIDKIDHILSLSDEFSVHVNMKHLTISDIQKHNSFIRLISGYLKEKYPQKLHKCYVYNAPFVFSQIFNIVSLFIDKDTQKKIELVVNK